MELGYCCINETLRSEKSVNRSMRKKTFLENGLPYVGELLYNNLSDMLDILKWNIDHSIYLYRMSSDMMPWMNEYEYEDLPNFSDISFKLSEIGSYVFNNGIRLSFHPGPFNVLGSQNSSTVIKTILELTRHAELMDLIGLERSPRFPINIHVSCSKPSKEIITKLFCDNFKKLPEAVKQRLTVENDDKPNQYSAKDLKHYIYDEIGVPLCFDQFHYKCGDQSISLEESLVLCHSTWDCTPLFHQSSSRRDYEDSSSKVTAHADYVYDKIITCGLDFDIDLEAKAKEKAVLRYRSDFLNR